ncbi:MAG: carbon-nitrogen hydrolase family protein [Conexivisphaerales archaeon]
MPKVAAVQPRTYRFSEEHKNLAKALEFVKLASKKDAMLVSFPEGYPGPYSGPYNYSCFKEMSNAAKEHGVYIAYGCVERAKKGSYYIVHNLIDGRGELVHKYRRVQLTPKPVNDVLLNRKKAVQGDNLDVVKTKLGRIGIIICSEIYSTELSRILTLKGADIILAPVGGMIYELYETWKTIAWARAIENLVYTIINQNLYGMEDGVAQICSPEVKLAELRSEGILCADIDLDRLNWLRENDETLELPKKYKVIPGLIRWRRATLYDLICGK